MQDLTLNPRHGFGQGTLNNLTASVRVLNHFSS